MKDIAWSKILSVGVEEIDEDHRKLVGTFNVLNHAVGEGEPPEYVAAILEELINCTVWHFSHEERLMLKYRFEGMEQHKAAHRELIAAARALQAELGKAERGVAEAEIVYLERWLTEHILTVDQRLGNFLGPKV